MGDGGFGMTISELSTAVQNNINTITIVMITNLGVQKKHINVIFMREDT